MKRVRITLGGKVVQEVPLEGELLVGRSSSCDLTIDDGQMSGRHLRISPDGDEAQVVDLGSTNGTFLDGSADRLPANEPVSFSRGAKLTVGSAVIELVESGAEAGDEEQDRTLVVGGGQMQSMLVNIARFKAAKPRLVIAMPSGREILHLTEMEMTVGRDPECTVVIEHASISSKHATIKFINGRFMLSDLKSSNGTFLDGNPVSAPTPIGNQSAVSFGTVDCLFVQKDPDMAADASEEPYAQQLADHTARIGKATQQQARDALAKHRDGDLALGEVFVVDGVIEPKDWAEIYKQRQIIGTLSLGSSDGGGGKTWLYVVIAIVVLGGLAAVFLS